MKNTTFVKVLAGAGIGMTGLMVARYFLKKKRNEKKSEELANNTVLTEGDKPELEAQTYTDLAETYTDGLKQINDICAEVIQEVKNDGAVTTKHEPAKPYYISAELFEGTCPTYEKIYVTYYTGNDVFVEDETEHVVADPNAEFGPGIRETVKKYEKRSVYIRNEQQSRDYKIDASEGSWNEGGEQTS